MYIIREVEQRIYDTESSDIYYYREERRKIYASSQKKKIVNMGKCFSVCFSQLQKLSDEFALFVITFDFDIDHGCD